MSITYLDEIPDVKTYHELCGSGQARQLVKMRLSM